MIRSLSCMVVLALLGLAGCSGGSGDGHSGDRGTVVGTITVDGAPVPKGCLVLFTGKDKGYTATGIVEEEGKYKLVYNDKRGMPAIEYLIQIAPPVEAISEQTSQSSDPTEMARRMNLSKVAKQPAVKGQFAAKYNSTTTSQLRWMVTAGENTVDLKLDK